MAEDSIYNEMKKAGISRRNFLKTCGLIAGVIGISDIPLENIAGLDIPAGSIAKASGYKPELIVARALESKPRVPIIWLELQDCAGCSEALTRSQSPTLGDLVLSKITVEYHETLSAAAGFQAEEAKEAAMKKYAGQYILVVEGSVSPKDGGIYCTIGGKSNYDILMEAAEGAAAIIATGNCAAFGGLPKAKPNPTGAMGVMEVITDKPIINVPGCPAIPEVFTGIVAHYLVFGTIPELDDLKRPKLFYGKTIHDRCLRRPFYDAGKYALSYDDKGAKEGWCLYKLGCKGPTTYNSCATLKWSGGLSFPIQSGHPCLGCSEPNFWDGGGFYQGQSAILDKPAGSVTAAAAGAGAAIGVGMALANQAKKKKAHSAESSEKEA